ncbi:MAG: hypothetical protein JXA61_07960 [Bacteroidales bacterium]|nr:hypothetical protein [Bacteroidales bacterium]
MKKILIYLSLIFFGFASGCSKDDDHSGNNGVFNESCDPVSFPGLTVSIDGDVYSDFDPQSLEYQDYIACIQNCAQTNPNDPQCMMDCLNSSGLITAGGAFSLSLELINSTDAIMEFNLDAGTWFYPNSDDYQSMLSVIPISIWIPGSDTINTDIPVFCLASDKSAPDMTSGYTICETIPSGGCLAEIVDVLQTKDMNGFTQEQTMQVQAIIWSCIEGEEVDMDYLNGLP